MISNLKKYYLNQELGILGQNYHGFDIYNDGKNKPVENNFIDKIKNNGGKYFMYNANAAITEKIEVNGDKDKKIKIFFHQFATDKFLGFNKFDSLYPTAQLPKLTIIDNSILYKDIFIKLGDKIFEGKLKYKLDKFYLDRDLYDEKKPEFIYQIVPYYEFDVEIQKGSNILELSYPIKSISNQFEYNGSIFYENKNEVNFKNRIRNK